MRIPLYLLAASRLRWLILVLTIGLWSAAFAVEPFTVKDIRVEGLQRSDAGTVFAALIPAICIRCPRIWTTTPGRAR